MQIVIGLFVYRVAVCISLFSRAYATPNKFFAEDVAP